MCVETLMILMVQKCRLCVLSIVGFHHVRENLIYFAGLLKSSLSREESTVTLM